MYKFLAAGQPAPDASPSTGQANIIGGKDHKVSPVVLSTGVLTKRAASIEPDPTPFELKLNVTDTEFVVVEDTSAWDTNAVILKVAKNKSEILLNIYT